jgi:hypothetical protein
MVLGAEVGRLFWFLAVVGWNWPTMIHDFVITGSPNGCLYRECDTGFRTALYALYPVPWSALVYYVALRLSRTAERVS